MPFGRRYTSQSGHVSIRSLGGGGRKDRRTEGGEDGGHVGGEKEISELKNEARKRGREEERKRASRRRGALPSDGTVHHKCYDIEYRSVQFTAQLLQPVHSTYSTSIKIEEEHKKHRNHTLLTICGL